jgi:hypothetical protein
VTFSSGTASRKCHRKKSLSDPRETSGDEPGATTSFPSWSSTKLTDEKNSDASISTENE